MTTVVFDGDILATDSKLVAHLDKKILDEVTCPHCNKLIDNVNKIVTKIFIPPKDKGYFKKQKIVAYAGVGNYTMVKKIYTLLIKGVNKLPSVIKTLHIDSEENDFTSLIITEQNAYTLDEKGKCELITQFPICIGSGSMLANYIMERFKTSPMKAIVETSLIDTQNTNSIVQYVKIVPDVDLQVKITTLDEVHELVKENLVVNLQHPQPNF